jgi:hypothetical protein
MSTQKPFITLLLMLSQTILLAQSARLWADSARVELGNPYTVHIEAQQPQAPDLLDVSDWFDRVPEANMLKKTPWQQVSAALWRTDIQMVLFDTGLIVLPSVLVGAASTDSLPIQVYQITLPDSAQLAPIADIIEAPLAPPTKANYLIWCILAFVGLLMMGLIWWLYRRYQHGLSNRNRHVPLSEDVWQVQFAALRKSIPAQPQKPFYDQLSWLLRSWIETKHRIPALERTTQEIGMALAATKIPQSQIGQIMQVLEAADGVKFAQVEPPLEVQLRYWEVVSGARSAEY